MRKLGWLAAGFTAAALAFADTRLTAVWWLAALVALAVLPLLTRFASPGKLRTAAIWCLCGLIAGTAWCAVWRRLILRPAQALTERTGPYECVVTDYPVTSYRAVLTEVRVATGGVPVGGRLISYEREARDLRPGDRILVYGSCRAGDDGSGGYDDLAAGRFLILRGEGAPERVGRESPLLHWPAMLAHALREKLADLYEGDPLAVLTAMLTGDRTLINRAGTLRADFSRSGTAHILAVSGMHVSILAGALQLIFGKRRGAAIPILFVTWGFAAMTGFSHSVVRAVLMQTLLLSAPLFLRESDGITSASFALLLILLRNPYAALSVGLQLSFAATLGMVWLSPYVTDRVCAGLGVDSLEKRRLRGTVRGAVGAVSGAACAALITAPVTACRFGSVSLISVATNLLILPVVELLFLLGAVSAALGFLWMPAADLAARMALPLVKYLTAVVRYASSVPMAEAYSANRLMLWWIWFAFLALTVPAAFRARARTLYRSVCLSAVLLSLVLLTTAVIARRTALAVTVLDVGQGQCVAGVSAGTAALVDCGGEQEGTAGDLAADALSARGIARVEVLVLTHYHEDHVNGALELMRRMPVRVLAMPSPAPEEADVADTLARLAEGRGCEVWYITDRTTFLLGNARLTVYPPVGSGGNDGCLAAVFACGEFESVVTGDLPGELEPEMIASGMQFDAEMIVAGHHGSRASCGEAFLDALTPEIAVISVGRDNAYGHPAPETLDRLAERDVTIYRTDLCGDVTVELR